MHNTINKNMIDSITVFRCGYCKSNLSRIFKNEQNKEIKFYSLAFLIKHNKEGYILYDTGYSHDIYTAGILSKVYNKILPAFCNESDEILYKLKNKNIKPEEIKLTILSHLHPDHIGGVKFLTNSKFVVSKAIYENYKSPFRSTKIIFSNLLTSNFDNNIILLDKDIKNMSSKYFSKVYDFFGDESIFLVTFGGHVKEQIGVFIPEKNIFLAADMFWGKKFVEKSLNMRFGPRLLQDNFHQYKQNIHLVKRLMLDGVKVIFSHDDVEDGWEFK